MVSLKQDSKNLYFCKFFLNFLFKIRDFGISIDLRRVSSIITLLLPHPLVMLKILAHLLVSMLAIWLTDYLIDGVHIYGDWMNVLLVTIVLGVVNATIGALLKALTFPLSLLTFWLVSFLISGLMVLLADYFLDNFSVDSYWYGLLFALVLSIIQWGFKSMFGMKK